MKTHFNANFLENSTETLRAVAHPIRIAIIDLLYNNGQMTVTSIYEQLQIEQAIAPGGVSFGLDLSPVMLHLTQQRTNALLCEGDACRLPFAGARPGSWPERATNQS